MYVEIAIVLTIALALGYLIANYVSIPSGSYQGASDFYDLQQENLVLSRKDLPWNEKPCTLRFAVFISESPRTLAKADCLGSPDSTTFKPSCADGKFEKCACNGTICSRCDVDKSYMFKILSKGDVVELWMSGYTTQNDKAMIPAILRVKTASTSSTYFMEAITLPAIPLRKWTVVTIVKEGRRFDIYYGAKLVTTQLLDNVPLTSQGIDWRAGHPKWMGKIGLFKGTTRSFPSEEVEQDVKSIVDRKGKPKALDALKLDLNVNFNTCMFGNCNQMDKVPPPNPYLSFTSNLA